MVSEMIVRNLNDEFHDGGYFQDLVCDESQ